MNMRGSNEAVRLNRALDHDRLAVRVGRRGMERDALPGDGLWIVSPVLIISSLLRGVD
jgi:hypothetical protein